MGRFNHLVIGTALLALSGCNQELSNLTIPGLFSTIAPVLPINPIAGPGPIITISPSVTPIPVASGSGSPASAASYFPSNLYFNQSVASAAVDAQSSTIINQLAANGGWGNNNRFQIDFSINVYYTDSSTVQLPVQDNGMYLPDSDVPATMPVPPAGGTQGFESSGGRTCDGGDCHYLVMDQTNHQLFETWEANDVTSTHFGTNGGLAVWPFNKTWLPNFRGDTCSSADAGGLMIAPMLFTAEEIAAGAVNHAIRLILPNRRIASMTYVRPATHMTGGSSWASSATGVPYGARLRLKSTFDVSTLPSAGARTIARALKTYGMILADGGEIALTAKSDAQSAAKYAGYLSAQDLRALQVTDFEMVDGGARFHPTGYDCVRNP